MHEFGVDLGVAEEQVGGAGQRGGRSFATGYEETQGIGVHFGSRHFLRLVALVAHDVAEEIGLPVFALCFNLLKAPAHFVLGFLREVDSVPLLLVRVLEEAAECIHVPEEKVVVA